jgi:hypothetical protein
MMADPEETCNALMYLNIDVKEIELFWIGRLFASLPPPSL